MVRNIHIDGVDVRSVFGVWVLKGGYNELFTFPALKEPVFNDWLEHDGVEVDLKSPKLQPLSVSIDFVASRSNANVDGFITLLAQPGYRTMQFPSLSRSFNLRLNDHVDFKDFASVKAFRLQFEMDEPTRTSFVYVSPDVKICASAYKIDGVSLSDYGIFVQRGRDSLLRKPPVKQNLTRNISTLDGRIYDAEVVHFAHKEVVLTCCLKASSMDRLWSCRDALFNQLISPGEHTLSYKGIDYPVFYKENSGCKLISFRSGLMMYEFDLKLTVIR